MHSVLLPCLCPVASLRALQPRGVSLLSPQSLLSPRLHLHTSESLCFSLLVGSRVEPRPLSVSAFRGVPLGLALSQDRNGTSVSRQWGRRPSAPLLVPRGLWFDFSHFCGPCGPLGPEEWPRGHLGSRHLLTPGLREDLGPTQGEWERGTLTHPSCSISSLHSQGSEKSCRADTCMACETQLSPSISLALAVPA